MAGKGIETPKTAGEWSPSRERVTARTRFEHCPRALRGTSRRPEPWPRTRQDVGIVAKLCEKVAYIAGCKTEGVRVTDGKRISSMTESHAGMYWA